jgi:hypothetical protein
VADKFSLVVVAVTPSCFNNNQQPLETAVFLFLAVGLVVYCTISLQLNSDAKRQKEPTA